MLPEQVIKKHYVNHVGRMDVLLETESRDESEVDGCIQPGFPFKIRDSVPKTAFLLGVNGILPFIDEP